MFSDSVIIQGNIDALIYDIENGAEWIYPIDNEIYHDLGHGIFHYQGITM